MKARRLTRGQRQLLELVAAGYTQAEVGRQVGISAASVDGTLGRARARFEARSTIELTAIALAQGEIDPARIRILRQQRAFNATAKVAA
ncbi:MAG: sigma factor-like helix-turn-helix DNA-binding protein [Allosphingosinicella sp.]|uniref:sigma factor-like helix-turn-helix DNA-binding protein n=1 Tax=Allosphingosinicella sp. TaxID=2823234 RepID=UPI00393BB421